MLISGYITHIERLDDPDVPMFTVLGSNGAIYTPCYLTSTGGSSSSIYQSTPLKIGSNVLMMRSDLNRPCYIIGGNPVTADQTTVKTTSPVTAGADEDYKGHFIDETVINNGGSRLTLSGRNNLVADAPSIKLQLGGGKLRISQDGSATNEVLNADPFIQVLFDYLVQLETRVSALTASLVTVNQLIGAATPSGSPIAQRLVEIAAEIVVATNAGNAVEVARLQGEATALNLVQAVNTGNTLNTTLDAVVEVRSNAVSTKNDDILIP